MPVNNPEKYFSIELIFYLQFKIHLQFTIAYQIVLFISPLWGIQGALE
jgi:hypothetical protein